MDPVRILAAILEHLNDTPVQGEQMMTTNPEEIEELEGGAEVRISWGGHDLFDLTIKRV
jgi:hypothetical protein